MFRHIFKAIRRDSRSEQDPQPRPNNAMIIMSDPCKFKSHTQLTHRPAYVQSYLGVGVGAEKTPERIQGFRHHGQLRAVSCHGCSGLGFSC